MEKKHWRLLRARITQLIGRQETLLPLPWPDEVEAEAQRIVARLVSRLPPVAGAGPSSSMETVDVASLEMVRPRSAGVEHVRLWAMEQFGIGDLLARLGFNRRSRAVAMGSIIGCMAVPNRRTPSEPPHETYPAPGTLEIGLLSIASRQESRR